MEDLKYLDCPSVRGEFAGPEDHSSNHSIGLMDSTAGIRHRAFLGPRRGKRSIMKYAKLFCFLASITLVSANRAFAFNWGFLRVPDWMDLYLAELLVASLFSYLGLAVTKPRGVSVKTAFRIKVSPVANFFRVFFIFSYSLMMVVFFTGMALRRYAEFSAKVAF